MKTVRINKLKKNLLIVDLPNGWDYEPIGDDKTFIYHQTEEETNDYHIEGYTLLGKPDELTNEDSEDLVEKEERIGKSYYMNYKDGYTYPFGALKSLLSAIETIVSWENSVSKPKEKDEWGNKSSCNYEWELEQWNEAESQTFNKQRTLIFIEN